MNLTTKLNARVTAILQYNTECLAIFSDECSINTRCLHIIEGKDRMDVYEQAKVLAAKLASTTRFPPVLMIISPDDKINLKHLQQQESYV